MLLSDIMSTDEYRAVSWALGLYLAVPETSAEEARLLRRLSEIGGPRLTRRHGATAEPMAA